MKRYLSVAVSGLLLAALAQGTSLAASGYISDWAQQPKMTNGYDFASQYTVNGSQVSDIAVVADDWQTGGEARSITNVRWWGSYWSTPNGVFNNYSDGLPNAASGGISQFLIKFWSNVPADTQYSFSRPGTLLSTNVVSIFNEEYLGKTSVTGEDVYTYHTTLATPFAASADTKYWVSIQAYLPDAGTAKQWGWHEADGIKNAWADQDWNGGGWYYVCSGSHDLAFELGTTVPEPGSLAALASGVVGMAAFALRRRKIG